MAIGGDAFEHLQTDEDPADVAGIEPGADLVTPDLGQHQPAPIVAVSTTVAGAVHHRLALRLLARERVRFRRVEVIEAAVAVRLEETPHLGDDLPDFRRSRAAACIQPCAKHFEFVLGRLALAPSHEAKFERQLACYSDQPEALGGPGRLSMPVRNARQRILDKSGDARTHEIAVIWRSISWRTNSGPAVP